MATKIIPHFKSICNGCMWHSGRIRYMQLSFLKRSIQFETGVSKQNFKGINLRWASKIVTLLTVGSFLYLYLREDERARKLKLLQEAGLREKCNFIADVVEVAADAVVHITKKEKALIFTNLKGGSGFIVDKDGMIITNAHVVGNQCGNTVEITLKNGKNFLGVVAEVDVAKDLALVFINGKNLPVLRLGSANKLRPGEWVTAIGSPHFLSNSVTAGIVSSVRRTGAEIGIPNPDMKYIQTDATVLHGNSGGPLVTLDGEVVGVNAMTVSPGLSFAIPVEYVMHFLESYERKKSEAIAKRKFYIGLSYLPLNQNTLEQLRFSGLVLPDNINHGMYLWKVEPFSPAHMSGLCAGDVLYEVEGEKIYNLENLYKKFETKGTVCVKLYRKGILYKANLSPGRVTVQDRKNFCQILRDDVNLVVWYCPTSLRIVQHPRQYSSFPTSSGTRTLTSPSVSTSDR